jgi:hypothetical protein
MVYYDPYPFLSTTTAITMPVSAPLIHPTTVQEAAFEREKAEITSYEQGWDRWDGPIWPIGYIQCRMRKYLRSESKKLFANGCNRRRSLHSADAEQRRAAREMTELW